MQWSIYLQTCDKIRKIQHYVFADWDTESDVPASPERFVAFIGQIKAIASSDGTILLHCRYDFRLLQNGHNIFVHFTWAYLLNLISRLITLLPFPHISRDGGGRSGLFCTVVSLLEKVKAEREVSVVNTVRRVKARRPNAIHCQVHRCVGYL